MALGGCVGGLIVQLEVIREEVGLTEVDHLKRDVHTNAHEVVIQCGEGEDGEVAVGAAALTPSAVRVTVLHVVRVQAQIGGIIVGILPDDAKDHTDETDHQHGGDGDQQRLVDNAVHAAQLGGGLLAVQRQFGVCSRVGHRAHAPLSGAQHTASQQQVLLRQSERVLRGAAVSPYQLNVSIESVDRIIRRFSRDHRSNKNITNLHDKNSITVLTDRHPDHGLWICLRTE